MNHTKADIRKNLQEGRMRTALNQALAYAEYCNLSDVVNGLTTQAAKLALHEDNAISGLLDYTTVSHSQAQLTHNLLAWTDRLPDVPKRAKGKRKPLQLRTFKNLILYLICFAKIIVLVCLTYLHSSGNFNQSELKATISVLLPTLAVYVSVILSDSLRKEKSTSLDASYVNGPLITLSFGLFPVYMLFLIFLLNGKGQERWNFNEMIVYLALVESVIGVYIAWIIKAHFKNNQ
ncbi:hypothetical protein [Neolewinella persica]|uniref:hypothetical protein n=1 Tax=Neolewinella persica TaxID=70998 RepID=UPI00035D3A90|nr:hypothetical protein [Neolewinella persica]